MEASGKCPRLRGDLVIQEIPEGRFAVAIEDRQAGVRVRLDLAGREILRLLDGKRDAGAIHEEIRKLGLFVPEDLVEKTFDFLAGKGFLVDPEGRTLAGSLEAPLALEGSFALRAGESGKVPRQLTFLPEARHECTGCGRCCHGYIIGPLERKDAERISEVEFEGGSSWLNRMQKVLEGERWGMRYFEVQKIGGRCLFLEPSGCCLLHRARGPEFKPAGCRIFPLHFTLMPSGELLGFFRMECFQHHLARKRGLPLAERSGEIRGLLGLARVVRGIPERLAAGSRRDLGLAEYLDLEEGILEGLAAAEDSFQGMLWTIGRAVDFVARGNRADLWRWNGGSPPPERNDHLLRAILSFCDFLARKAGDVAGRSSCDAFSRVLAATFRGIAAAYVGGGVPSDQEALRSGAGPDSDPESREILREVLRNEVFSKEWILGGDLERGYALLLVRHLLIEAAARIFAARRDAPRTLPAAAAEAIALVNRTFRLLGVRSYFPEDEVYLDEIIRSF